MTTMLRIGVTLRVHPASGVHILVPGCTQQVHAFPKFSIKSYRNEPMNIQPGACFFKGYAPVGSPSCSLWDGGFPIYAPGGCTE